MMQDMDNRWKLRFFLAGRGAEMGGVMIRVGILDGDKAFRKTLRDAFMRYSSGIEVVWDADVSAAQSTADVCSKVSSLRISALFISGAVPHLSAVVEGIRQDLLLHTVVAVIAGEEDGEQIYESGADFIIRKTSDLFTISARLCSLCAEHAGAWEKDRERMRLAALGVLEKAGFDPLLCGTGYLATAAVLAAYDRDYLHSVSALYFAVGNVCGTTDSSVEKSVRSSIRKAYEKADGAEEADAPLCEIFFAAGRPTAAKCIAALTESVLQIFTEEQRQGDYYDSDTGSAGFAR